MTRCTPDRPRATSSRRKASQPAPSSAEVTSRPRISRWPPALTAVATRTWTLMIRPPSRTFWVRASSVRVRNVSTCASSASAIS
ncbi:hypothetical protein FHR33_008832 [Nonomuraea dietziae]|uniref:Uncharacterized protein n=1 Tax=Nonomuraea dietziae TaxID=65515 RepID=A0A7W5VIU1_9ACTN|nr:hypothetical protein [Nonomuraea dietziae]